MTVEQIVEFLLQFVFAYPFIMSFVWMGGALYYMVFVERDFRQPDRYPNLPFTPKVSIIVPCHNESENIRETIAHLLQTVYPDYEILCVNDGSKDNTGDIINELSQAHANIRAVHLMENCGKPMAQRMGALMSNGDIIVCMDGDALFEPYAVAWLVNTLLQRNRIGGVTGNPRIRNRTSLLGKIQVGEFSSIIGLIKRSQMSGARLFTVSGVICAFKKEALHEAGYWRTDMITDDIDITWRLMTNRWWVFYQPTAVCWILMPETLKGLWKQRLRWSQGGAEIFRHYGWKVLRHPSLRMIPMLIDYMLSLLWSNTVAVVLIFVVLSRLQLLGTDYRIFVPSHWGLTLSLVFLLQSLVSLLIDRRYEKDSLKSIVWMIWYPFAYWIINAGTAFVGFYKTLFNAQKKFATWISPDRGLK